MGPLCVPFSPEDGLLSDVSWEILRYFRSARWKGYGGSEFPDAGGLFPYFRAKRFLKILPVANLIFPGSPKGADPGSRRNRIYGFFGFSLPST